MPNSRSLSRFSGKAGQDISVLHVIGSLSGAAGGPSRCVPDLCLGSSAAGIRVGIAFMDGAGELSMEAKRLPGHGVRCHPLRLWDAPWALWRIARDYDVVHVNGVWSFLPTLGCLIARLRHKPLVVAPHGMLEPWSLAKKRLKKKLGLWLYQGRVLRMASVLQATAASEATNIRDLGLGNPVAVIANGVQIPAIKGSLARLKGKARRLLFLSRIHPKKGVLELVRAVAALRTIIGDGHWIVTVAGPDEGGHLAEVQAEAQRLGVLSFFEFPGSVEDEEKWSLYRSADLFVLPTYSENFGLVIAEALGCGVPVVTTQGAPWSELESHHCGWWHPIGQKNLEAALKEALLCPPRTLKAMGGRGRKLVQKRYGWDLVVAQLEQLYLWVLGRRGRPEGLH